MRRFYRLDRAQFCVFQCAASAKVHVEALAHGRGSTTFRFAKPAKLSET
jgi:hypothetical protein